MANHQTYMRLISSGRWRALRRKALARHPACVRCESQGRITVATEVHHVVPCEGAATEAEMKRLMFDPHNLMPVCHACHVELHKEMGRSGKAHAARKREEERRRFERLFLGTSSSAATEETERNKGERPPG